ncbi:MAG: hypothetical protein ACOY99_05800 [Pseudomonadota bacterium]
MQPLATRHQLLVAMVLAAVMAATRGQFDAVFTHLPGASWAVFFLAGVYLRPPWVLPLLLVEAWLLDFAAFTWGGVDDFCLTPAYLFLLPAYGALWLAGRGYARRYRLSWATLGPLALSLVVGAAASELFSSGGFYFFSGRFAAPTMAEFIVREGKYFPPYINSLFLYVALAAVVHIYFALLSHAPNRGHALRR